MVIASKAILVLPHQDDEMFIFHRLRSLLDQGAVVHAVWVTDGASHDADLRRDPTIRLFFPILVRADNDTIRRIRERESTNLMRTVGVPADNLTFLGHPSGRLAHCFAAIFHDLRKLFCRLQPQEIYTVAFDHSHIEHDLCNAAVRLAAPPSTRLYEFPVLSLSHGLDRYRWLVPRAGWAIRRTPFSRGQERLRLELFRKAFPSQWSVALLERLCGLFPSDYRRFGEPYREMPEHDYSKPIAGLVPRYRPNSTSFDDVRCAVLPFLENRHHAPCVDE
jgi:LmbE family N-acetylglucosaminyl deacetylase